LAVFVALRFNQHHYPAMCRIVFIFLCLSYTPLVTAAEFSFLHTRGQDIVNERGQKVLLRGVGLGNWLLPEGYMWKFGTNFDRPRTIEKLVSDLIGSEDAARFWAEFRSQYITEADIQRISALGYNSVRPALNARLFLTETIPPIYREEGFKLLDDLVGWCKHHGLYVIIDMHAAPGGQTGSNIDDSRNDQPLLFAEDQYRDQLEALWKKIAERYRDEPAVAGYDLLNEPLPERTGAAPRFKKYLEPLYARLTRAIRQVDSRHMIVVEGADWANDWSVFTKPFDRNQVYQFHYYCWDRPAVRKGIGRYLQYRARFNAPVWVGETGERDERIYWATTEYFEANNIGWCFWPWKKMDTRNTPFSISPPKKWVLISDYSKGGAKPSPEIARPIFQELLANIRLTNCVFYPEVVNAMLRRAPVRIQAENFGPEGSGKSFRVMKTSKLSAFYRPHEAVPIDQTSTGRNNEFAIQLQPGEWTAYTVAIEKSGQYGISIRAKPAAEQAELELQIGSEKKRISLTTRDFSELPLGTFTLQSGLLKLRVSAVGAVQVDWIEIKSA
jgi:endoglucanase